MEIEPTENTPQVAHKGKIYYFCNEECKNKFIADPQKYVA
jgi:Cu+-exporting ATPase